MVIYVIRKGNETASQTTTDNNNIKRLFVRSITERELLITVQ